MQLEITIHPIILAIFTAINIAAFFYVLLDKSKAVVGNRRIPEVNFFLLGIFGGSIGTLLGMYIYRHKTRKWYFVYGLGFLALENWLMIDFLSDLVTEYL